MSSLLRSTKFVRYFTGAARNLILNTAKTAEVNTLINPKTLCVFNNVGVRDYATSKKPESLEPLLQKLDSEVRRFGRITKRDIDEVFDEIRVSHDITSSQSLLVIRCCGELVPEELPEQRTLLVQKIWNILTERGVPMDISHYNALLRVYLENEHPFSPAKFLEELEKKGLQPNRVTYQRLMWRYCQEGDVDGATRVLEKMRELNMPVSEPVLNALVMGHAFHGDTEGAKAVLETMAGAGLEPSNHTYALLACGYAKQGDVEGVEKVIKMAEGKDVLLSDKDILDIIEHMTLGGHGDKVEKLFHHLKKGPGYNQDVCNLIFKLLNKGHEDTAKKVMKTMPKSPNVDDTVFKGAFFIKQLLRLNKPPDAVIKTCLELREEGLIPNAIFIATEAALQQGQIEMAQELFKELKKEGKEIRQHYFWPLLAQKGKEGDEEGLLQILRNMVGEGHTPSGETLRDYVLPYLMSKDSVENILLKLQIANVPMVHAARNLLIELLESGKIKEASALAVQYRPRGQYSLLIRPMLNALNKTKDVESFATILQVISVNPMASQNEEDSANDDAQTDDANEVGRIVKSAVKNLNDPKLSEKLLKACLVKGVRISTDSAHGIEQNLGQHMTTSISELLSQLTSSDLETVPIEAPKRAAIARNALELEQLYNRLKNRPNANLNRIQKQLLTAYIRENNTEKVESFLKQLEASNFELNVSTLAQLFEFYCQNDQIEKAKEVKARIAQKDPEFHLSKLKIVQMAYALVRANKFDEAVQYLKENRSDEEVDNQNYLYNSKCWQMLNTLAEQKEDVKVREMTKTLIENEFIAPSNVILGPLIKVHLLKDDLEGALKEFEHCCNTYRSTPWKGELMKALIMKEDATRLQWLADLSTQIHGEVNILHDLVLAFVECGRLRQARRILETPGLQARHRRLDDACQRYVDEGKSEYLEGLLEATKELSHIDRSNIFYHLLVTYCKADETDKALGLWTILQEEGEIPSDQFLHYLGSHLRSKNRKVPFVLPDDKLASQSKSATISSTPHQQKPAKAQKQKPETALTKKTVSDKLNALIDDGKLNEAMDFAIKCIKEGVTPRSPTMKFLLKTLAEKGNVEKIKELEGHLTDNLKREFTFDDKLTNALFMRGEAPQHIDKLLQSVTNATSDEQFQDALKSFPRSLALSHVIDNEDIVQKCHKVAEIAASKGYVLPANILWMEYLLAGRDTDADSLYKLWLKDADKLLFRRLLQEAHNRKQPQIIEKLITALKSNQKISQGSLATAYSRLINLYLMEDRTNDALAAYEIAVKLGVPSSSFYKNTLERLNTAAEEQGKKLNV